ncbi:hypothetical protein [Serratia symbiotica]|uniref:Uncharacterized protein n=1 Tax=Serratia symbiotica TaxID=138074 RepID=A0A7D5NTC0_9GAMM|nr:hypothetical protein [Serratia symbiotica]QLH64529.1 hypothetical protein SYMBAF_17030 [Serratia symbiotica]
MKLKITLIILAGFVCAVMTASAFSADGSINLDGGEANNVPSSKSTVIGNQNTVPQDNSVVIGQQNETKQYNTSENHPRIIIGDKNQANAGPSSWVRAGSPMNRVL